MRQSPRLARDSDTSINAPRAFDSASTPRQLGSSSTSANIRQSPRIARDTDTSINAARRALASASTPRQLGSSSTSATRQSPRVTRDVDIGFNTPRQTAVTRHSPHNSRDTVVARSLSNGEYQVIETLAYAPEINSTGFPQNWKTWETWNSQGI
jgi:hypothetical protein